MSKTGYRKKGVIVAFQMAVFTVGLATLLLGVLYYKRDAFAGLVLIGMGIVILTEYFRGVAADETNRKNLWFLWFVLIIGLGLGVRWLMIDIVLWDTMYFSVPWYDQIKSLGGWEALSKEIGDHSSPYYYYLALVSYWPIKSVVAVKMLPILFDFVTAVLVYKIVRLKDKTTAHLALLSFALVVLWPTLVINSAAVGQTDSVYVAFLLGSLYFILKIVDGQDHSAVKVDGYKVLALVFFALAVIVKVYAVIFILPIALLYISGLIKRFFFLLIPAVCVAVILPRYMLGLSLMQALNWTTLAMNGINKGTDLGLASYAPTVYRLVPYLPIVPYNIVAFFSAAVLVILMMLFFPARKSITKETVVRMALVSLLAIPYVLPGMRERYFLPAEIMAIVYAFYFHNRWFVPILLSAVMLVLASYHHWYCCKEPFFEWYQLSIVMGVLVVIVIKDYFVNEVWVGSKK